MEIDLSNVAAAYRGAFSARQPRRVASDRRTPSLFQYDYLSLSRLVADVEQLIAQAPSPAREAGAVALDLGCGRSPYRDLIESCGFTVKTMDIDDQTSPDYVGSIEAINLPDHSIDLVICTQVLEHSLDPGRGVREILRILRPGGYLIASAPHIWFYHPHPSDNWRFTQEGLIRLVAGGGFEPQRLLSQGGTVLCFFQVLNFVLFGVLGRGGAPVYAITNIMGRLGDRLLPNSLFCVNFAILARKGEDSGSNSSDELTV